VSSLQIILFLLLLLLLFRLLLLFLSVRLFILLGTSEWLECNYLGNKFKGRWGHTASLHHDKFLLIVGGMSDGDNFENILIINISMFIDIFFLFVFLLFFIVYVFGVLMMPSLMFREFSIVYLLNLTLLDKDILLLFFLSFMCLEF
jgi:hypothetical protein